MPLPNYKEIVDLLKKGATIEAQERIMELREAALALQEENIQLRNSVIELEEKVRILQSAEGEPCPKCRKRAWVVESSLPHKEFGEMGVLERIYLCKECGFTETIMVTPK